MDLTSSLSVGPGGLHRVGRPPARRSLAIVVGLAVVAGACGSSSNDVAEGAAEVGATTDADALPAPWIEADPEPVDQISGDPEDESVERALSNRDHESFPPALVDISDIRSGGPPPDGIPPIDEPLFLPAGAVDFLEANDPVLLVEVEGEARVYPIQIMTWHELVNDTIAGVPITVSYCPLCNSALTYRRELDGRTLDFGTSGSLYNSSLVMYDRQTGSLWTHYDGRGIVGALAGAELDLIPTSTVAWAEIVRERPDALVLSQETGHDRDYGQNPYSGYDDPGGSPFLFDGDVDDRLLPQTRVLTVVDDEAVAINQTELQDAGAVTFEHQDRRLVALLAPGAASALETFEISDGRDVGSTGVFVAVGPDGEELTFERDGRAFRDAETGSTWNVLGEATDGPLAGHQLEAVPHLDTFWFAAQAFRSDLQLIEV